MKFIFIAILSIFITGVLSSTEQSGCGENEIFNECGSPCDKTCAEPFPTCIEMCQARCECKPGFVIHSTTKKCVDIKSVQNN